jgi:hypothetical protein
LGIYVAIEKRTDQVEEHRNDTSSMTIQDTDLDAIASIQDVEAILDKLLLEKPKSMPNSNTS